MRIICRIIIVLSLAFTFLLGCLPSLTFAWHDGKMWNKLDNTSKAVYMAGYRDGEENGLSISNICENKTPKTLKIEQDIKKRHEVLYNADLQQVVSGVDEFYSDYANIYIPIPIALHVVTDRIQGISEEELQKYIEERRKEVSDAINEIKDR